MASALALLTQGANGRTLNELSQGLQLNTDKNTISNEFSKYSKALNNGVGSSIFSIANRIYVQEGYQINPNFSSVAANMFQSGVESVDFRNVNIATRKINHFVENQTNRKIKDLIKPDMLGPDSRLILINAIYFKGAWEQPFNPNRTTKGDFYISETEKVSADFMNIEGFYRFNFLNDLNITVIEMDYINSNLSMVIVVPYSRIGLSALERNIKNQNLATIIRNLMETDEVEFSLPKFKIESEIKLNDVLKNVSLIAIDLEEMK